MQSLPVLYYELFYSITAAAAASAKHFTNLKATCSIQGSKHWLFQSLKYTLSVQHQRLMMLKLLYPHLQHFAALGLSVTKNKSV